MFKEQCSVRVSNELGAGNPKSAAFSVVVVTMLSFVLSSIVAVVILLFSGHISYIYTGGKNVAAAVSKLTPLLALTIILNGIQPVLSGILEQKEREMVQSLWLFGSAVFFVCSPVIYNYSKMALRTKELKSSQL